MPWNKIAEELIKGQLVNYLSLINSQTGTLQLVKLIPYSSRFMIFKQSIIFPENCLARPILIMKSILIQFQVVLFNNNFSYSWEPGDIINETRHFNSLIISSKWNFLPINVDLPLLKTNLRCIESESLSFEFDNLISYLVDDMIKYLSRFIPMLNIDSYFLYEKNRKNDIAIFPVFVKNSHVYGENNCK